MIHNGWHTSYGYGLYVEDGYVTAFDKKDPCSLTNDRISAKLWEKCPNEGYLAVKSGEYTLRQVQNGLCRRRFIIS